MGKPVLMDFYAEWCGPCHLQSPIIDKLKQKMGDQVEIRKIDVGTDSEQTRRYAARYDIQFVPTLVIEKDGALIRKLVGVQSLETLESILKPLIDQ
ncbi:MAG TPA: thioredoxin domain-containing protein [Candidatus Methanoculleus thermohydrogenotrophicum]|jgi:thioredoxin 1|nr:thioredoxin domain-containing protein [Candidatus Methanoculleus thermohydrogenotrophicum]NLM81560.1 thioredoxin fold domain-containing protein [Candidatus Methanoculleus thermohydrogenotrophicum]HOB18449.1 thioredoxin domain-containing protein [Candidatus Methanoculleus thermohydrogenotrophicum]HPZ38505.1 thioredoxin domain-containing protein [Candidatus Methanoculleus thermohydrogenotrophicum]HQC91660.1 thioredoxin domain-containing protein [Candidatus Methanoculleus thermohydrogenotrophic